MPQFFPLTVTEVHRETRDAVVVSLKPDTCDQQAFQFTQGQYLTFKREFDGVELRRSYSICAGEDDPQLRVGVKRVDGGVFSTWINESLTVGDRLETLQPMGNFSIPTDAAASRHYLAVAAGSGITPILSLIKTTLVREPLSRFTVLFANRSIHSIMFREELEDLKNQHMGRLSILHVLKSESQHIELFSGRIDEHKCSQFFTRWIDVTSVDVAYICGPESLMQLVATSLRQHGLSDQQIRYELFAASQPGRASEPARSRRSQEHADHCIATVLIDGGSRVMQVPWQGQSILEAALAAQIDAPFACKAGVCSTCRAQVLEGDVDMVSNHALEDYEVERGYVLTCQCYPVSDTVTLSYDA